MTTDRRALRTRALIVTAVSLLLLAGLFFAACAAGAAGASAACNGGSPGSRASLPDCRVYEMVTPPYKESFQASATGISEDGSQLLVESLGNLLTPDGTLPEGTGLLGHSYRLLRTEAGWKSVPEDAPFARLPNFAVLGLSPRFESGLWLAGVPGQSTEDLYYAFPGDSLTRMGPGAPPGVLETVINFEGASEDMSHALLVVRSANEGLEEDPLWPGDTTFSERHLSLYEYAGTGNAEPELVGVKNQTSLSEAARIAGRSHINEAAELISNCGTVLGGGPPAGDAYNAVSASGAIVFFTSAGCAGGPPADELYARVNQERTVAISEPPLTAPGRVCTTEACKEAETVPGNRRPAVFMGASLDGSRVLFRTSQPLVDGDIDSGVDLYEADINENVLTHEAEVTRVVQVSRGGEGDPTPGSGAGVLGVARISEDGSHVYFVAQGVLTGANGEGKTPIAGEPNLYVSVRGCPGGEGSCPEPVEHTSFIATLAGADGQDWSSQDERPVQATTNGRFLVFQSTADLTPDQEGWEEAGQVFEYDAQTGRLTRVSRGKHGYNADGNSKAYPATIPIQSYSVDTPDVHFTGLAVSADGSRVFFSSADALTPQAIDGVTNIYEYHGGEVGLISDGHDLATVAGKTPTTLIGTDESGQDVFFETADPLVPQDRDTWVDIYDARIEGGFAAPRTLTPCSGDSCQGDGSTPPSLPVPGVSSGGGETAVTTGVLQSVKAKTKKKAKRPAKPKKRRRSARKHGRGRGARAVGRGRKS